MGGSHSSKRDSNHPKAGYNLVHRQMEGSVQVARSANRILWLAVWWLWMPVVYFVWYGFINIPLFAEGWDWSQKFDQFFMANMWSMSVLFWVVLCIGFIGSAVIWFMASTDDRASSGSILTGVAVFAILALVCSVLSVRVFWDNDKDLARYYNQATKFYVENPDEVPDSLARLVKDARTGGNSDCALVGSHDVPSCIKQGTLPVTGWDARVGSLDGARIALSRTSGDVQRVSLKTETLAYLNEEAGRPARWSGILDGKGITQSLAGVAEWTGEGRPSQCLFKDDFAIDRAFAGGRSNALGNLLADKFPDLRYSMSDVWGYCDGNEPIVIVPMKRQIYFKDRTVDAPGGLVIVRGDHGDTKLTYQASAKAGEFPGPVYPASLVVRQRTQAEWAAGRQNQNRNGFGYEPATSEAQAGNVSEYLLRDKASGRLMWVTPLTLRKSSSELFVAYALTYADEITDRSLNELSIYVLDDGDRRRINVDNLEADARNYFVNNAGTFISNGGKLVEFIPVDGDVWRAFGELNGRVVYRLDISANGSITPRLVAISPEGEPEAKPGEGPKVDDICGKPVAELNAGQLANCLKQFADELARRSNNQGQPSK